MTEYFGTIEADPVPEHDITLRPTGDDGLVQATCSCGLYQSTPVRNRQRAYALGRAHVRYSLKKWRSVL